MKHAALPLLLFLCRCRQRKVNEIVKLKFLAGTTRCQTTNNSSCGLLVVYSSCCLGLYIFVKGFRRANKQRGLYPRELTFNGIEKRFETSHGIADQNTFWVLNKASKRHKKSNSFQYIWRWAYIRRDLMGLLVVVVVRGEVRKRQFFSKLKWRKQSKYK